MQPTWVNAVKQLCDLLQQNEDRSKLLRKIDKAMTEQVTLEDLISSILTELVKAVRASDGHFYVVSGEELILANTTSLAPAPVPPKLSRSSLLAAGMRWQRRQVACPTKDDLARSLKGVSSAENLLFATVFLSQEDCFGVLILESQNPGVASPFKDPSVTTFIGQTAEQLSNVVNYRLEMTYKNNLLELIEIFLKENFRPSTSLKELAKKIPKFLPSFGPLRIVPEPKVQILFYDKEKNYLTIRATTENERDITRVSIVRSVCGMLVEEPNRPYILCDPTESPYKERYKAYLGGPGKIRTEFAFPITFQGEMIAIVNLESEKPNAFLERHVEEMNKRSQDLVSLIAALKQRTESGWDKQKALGSALDNYLGHARQLLRHGTATPASTVVFALDLIQQRTKGKDPWIDKHIGVVRENFKTITAFVDRYGQDIAGLAKYGGYSIRKLVSDAIKPLGVRELAKKNIQIDLKEGPPLSVFCTPLLRQHIYNVVNNAVYSVRKRLEKEDDRPGRIVIKIQPEPEPDKSKERILNRRCSVTIWDNGEGVTSDDLEEIRKVGPRFTTKKLEGGTGYGLYAARQYLASIKGWIEFDSIEGEYFVAKILLDIFDPEIHGGEIEIEEQNSSLQRASRYTQT